MSSFSLRQQPRLVLTNEKGQAAWDRANETLDSVLFMRATGAAASLAKKFKPRVGASNGLAVWAVLKEKHMPSDESNKRVLLRQLDAMLMEEGTDPGTSRTKWKTSGSQFRKQK